MKRILMRIESLILAVILSWMTYVNISSGRIIYKFGGYITAADNPHKFWVSIVFGVFLIVVFIFAAFLKAPILQSHNTARNYPRR